MNKRIVISASAIIMVVALAIGIFGMALHHANADDSANDTTGRVVYERNLIDVNNFGSDVHAEAQSMVAAGEATSVQDAVWHENEDGTVSGIFYNRMYHDPALMGAIATDLLNREEIDWRLILGPRYKEFENVPIGELPDKLHQEFRKDFSFWDLVLANVCTHLKSGSVSIIDLDGYDSSMYMLKDALLLENGEKVPAVVVRHSINAGGHAIVFDLGKAGVFKFRLECGFQPVDVHYWPVPPDTPPEDDDPGTGDPEPELEPKDTEFHHDYTNPDHGVGEGNDPRNQNPDTTVTDEPTSPSSYTPPSRPVDDASSGTQSGSQAVDHGNGTTETHGGQSYEVQAGDGQNHTDLGEVQANPPAVEEPVSDDGTNTGDIGAPE